MQKRNQDIRDSILKNNLKLWQVGAALRTKWWEFFTIIKKRINGREKETDIKNNRRIEGGK